MRTMYPLATIHTAPITSLVRMTLYHPVNHAEIETNEDAAQQMPDLSHPAPVVDTRLSHDDIAKCAYEIYVENGCRQGQSEQNWLQAKRELKNQQNWLQAGGDVNSQGPAGYPGAY